jgi:hypothetical protein
MPDCGTIKRFNSKGKCMVVSFRQELAATMLEASRKTELRSWGFPPECMA